ncbi:hypothetical protein LIER_06355 [Lithospermum erythrorhizon]|uniref:Reverse transcriptase zinc-binding domain-containing protein n=1 Tax=Lithospermum erythrorhizon TaxID=34254 RepID=A0AAV3P5S4_LITER
MTYIGVRGHEYYGELKGIGILSISMHYRLRELFTSQTGGNMFNFGQLNSNQLERDAVDQMEADFTKEEIKHCLFTMNGSKAPGPDGMLRKSGTGGYMSIKLDMLKAYDRIEWAFLRAMLTQLGFSAKWVYMIMTYVESVTYSLMINEKQVGYITPRRGLDKETLYHPIYSLFALKMIHCYWGKLQWRKLLLLGTSSMSMRRGHGQKLNSEDILEWTGNKKHEFTIKSAYHLIRETKSQNVHSTTSSTENSQSFDKLWKIRIARKITHFLYGAIHNILATTDKLVKRGVHHSRFYSLHQQEEEDVMHVLYFCRFTQEENWNRLPRLKFNMGYLSLDTWNQRNQIIREKPHRNTLEIVKFGCGYLETQRSALEDLLDLKMVWELEIGRGRGRGRCWVSFGYSMRLGLGLPFIEGGHVLGDFLCGLDQLRKAETGESVFAMVVYLDNGP